MFLEPFLSRHSLLRRDSLLSGCVEQREYEQGSTGWENSPVERKRVKQQSGLLASCETGDSQGG